MNLKSMSIKFKKKNKVYNSPKNNYMKKNNLKNYDEKSKQKNIPWQKQNERRMIKNSKDAR